jgi:hypothetical protein
MTPLYQIDKVISRNIFTFAVIYLLGQNKHYSGMTNSEVRRENARLLATKVGGDAKFAEMMDMDASQVSHIIGKTPVKNIGNIIARRIEDKFALPRGWLDTPHFEEGKKPFEVVESERIEPEGITINQIVELLTLFEQATPRGREMILDSARTSEKRGGAGWQSVIDNK